MNHSHHSIGVCVFFCMNIEFAEVDACVSMCGLDNTSIISLPNQSTQSARFCTHAHAMAAAQTKIIPWLLPHAIAQRSTASGLVYNSFCYHHTYGRGFCCKFNRAIVTLASVQNINNVMLLKCVGAIHQWMSSPRTAFFFLRGAVIVLWAQIQV